MRPASREAVERSLLFLAAFHWSRSVRGEASLALRRLQSKRSVPHPTVWGVKDCLKWLSCVDLDGMCRAAKAFLGDGRLSPKLDPFFAAHAFASFMFVLVRCCFFPLALLTGIEDSQQDKNEDSLEIECPYQIPQNFQDRAFYTPLRRRAERTRNSLFPFEFIPTKYKSTITAFVTAACFRVQLGCTWTGWF